MAIASNTAQPENPNAIPRRNWKLEVIGGLALIGLITVMVIILTLQTKNPSRPTTTNTASYPGVPESFTDFSGRVANITGNLVTVSASEISSSGAIVHREYLVTIADTTVIQTVQATDLTADGKPAKLADITPDTKVIVADDTNLAKVTAFTATTFTIIK